MTDPEKDNRKLIKARIRLYRSDFVLFCCDCVKIVDKSGNIVPLILNEQQLALWFYIKHCLDNDIPIRVKISKARQMGFTTMISALGYWMMWSNKHYSEMICTQDIEASSGILERIKFINDYIPTGFKPAQKKSNKSELIFDLPDGGGQDSEMRIKTAGNPRSLRSDTRQFLHLSEVAFWPNAEECALAVLQIVDKLPKTMIFFETTSNGMGGYWHSKWYADDGYHKLFFGWQDFKSYRSTAPADFVRSTDSQSRYGNEEIEAERLGLDNDQLQWRRETIDGKCGGDIGQFMQEYPGTPEDSFQSSGKSRFDLACLREIEVSGLLGNPLYEARINVLENKLSVTAQPGGGLKVYRPYVERRQYMVVADISEGITNDNGATGDFSHVKVVDIEKNDICAEWHGLAEPSDVGHIEVYLARAYGGAVIVQEINNHGHAAMVTITQIEKYPRSLIFTQSVLRDKPLEGSVGLGWRTTEQTRDAIINDLALAIRDGELFKINRDDLVELYTFVGKRVGGRIKYQAETACHDDRVIVMAIATFLLRTPAFTRHYKFDHPEWEICSRCAHYNQPKSFCHKQKTQRSHRDVCRLYEANFDDSE